MSRKKTISIIMIAAMVITFFWGCSENKKNEENNKDVEEPISTPEPTLEPAVVKRNEDAVQIYVENTKTMQTIEGFGAGFTWYSDFLTKNKNKEEAFDLLFKDAGFTILRFKNNYKQYSEGVDAYVEKQYYEAAKKRAQERGEEVKVLLSSWTPSEDLKESGFLNGGSSIKKNKSGEYMYQELAEYFYQAVEDYERNGVPIDYLSIQNECDFVADYDGCEYSFIETDSLASYAKAYLAVYNELKKMQDPPKMMGPETMSIDYMHIKLYMDEILKEAPESVYAIAHHLYSGGTYTDPGSFQSQMIEIAKNYPDVSRWQTEFYRGDIMATAEIIHNSMVYENLNAYLYWDGVWQSDSGLLSFENPDSPVVFESEKGYLINENFYAMRHFSEFIRPGYKRVRSAITDKDKKNNILVSTYASEEQDTLVAVIINKSDKPENVQLHFENYHISDSAIYQSICAGAYEPEGLYKKSDPLEANQTFYLPQKGIATVVLHGKTGAPPINALDMEEEYETVEEKIAAAKAGTTTLRNEASEWEGVEKQAVQNVANGDHGASASFQTMYDRENLYVRVEVSDETPSTSAVNISDKDSIELYINESGKKPTRYGANDYHYRVGRDGVTDETIERENDKFRAKVYETKDGYVVEALIPLVSVPGVPGKMIGFDVQVNDSHDGDKRNYVLKWCDASLYTNETLEFIGMINFR